MSAVHGRDVVLSPKLNAFVDELVASGSYADAGEVIHAGLLALKGQCSSDEMTRRISIALDQLDAGEGITGEPEDVLGGILDEVRSRRGV